MIIVSVKNKTAAGEIPPAAEFTMAWLLFIDPCAQQVCVLFKNTCTVMPAKLQDVVSGEPGRFQCLDPTTP